MGDVVTLVLLKDGSRADRAFVETVLASARIFRKETYEGFLEFMNKCRRADVVIHIDFMRRLRELDLIERNGTVHNTVRRVILSAVTKDFNLKVGSPYAFLAVVSS